MLLEQKHRQDCDYFALTAFALNLQDDGQLKSFNNVKEKEKVLVVSTQVSIEGTVF
jgi:hypothetical protein